MDKKSVIIVTDKKVGNFENKLNDAIADGYSVMLGDTVYSAEERFMQKVAKPLQKEQAETPALPQAPAMEKVED